MAKILELDSGYTVRVRPKGPFAFDHIMRKFADPPMVTRKITLATGDEVEWPYSPPETEPDKKTEPEEWALWARELSRRYKAFTLKRDRDRELAHFFLLDAIDVVKTPYPVVLVWIVNAIKWGLRLWGAPVEGVLAGKGYLKFLKTQVIASKRDWDRVQEAATVEEVTMDGVLDQAARSFRDILGQRIVGQGA